MGRFLLTSALILFSTTYIFCQTQFWSDDFEDAGSPSSGTRAPSVQNSFGGPPATRYFFRTTPTTASIALQGGVNYTGHSNSKVWAAEDIDAALTGSNFGQSSHQSITWSGINISGKIGLSFRGLFACNNSGGIWEGPAVSPADYMIVEYRINGGAWNSLVRIFSNNSLGGNFSLETTGDSIGESPVLTSYLFTEFTASIPGTGTTLDLRFKCSSNGGTTEELAIDNFRLFNTASLPVELTDFSSECDGNEEKITWTSETEKDFEKYTLERSGDGELFERIADIQPKGAPDKPAVYELLLPGTATTVYYRLKMTDLNGTSRYSWTISSKNCLDEKQLLQSCYVEEDRLTCFFTAPGMRCELLSLSGAPAMPVADAGNETKCMTPLSVRSGIYLLQVTNREGTRRETHRIFVP